MKYRNAPRKTAKGKSLLLTFLLLLSIPVFVYGVLQDSNFDIRNMAFEDVEVSEETPCVISFPNVNPYSLEVDKTVRVQVDALSTTLGVKALSIQDENQNKLLQKTYAKPELQVTETFSFTPEEVKGYELTGLMVDVNEKTYTCIVSSPYDIKGIRAISNNSKPMFSSTAKESKPSQSIVTSDTYEYTLTATDPDGDTINYFFSFTPGTTWLKPTIIEDGSNGKLTLKFKGSTTNPASYLANVFIHDGYSKHLASQSWVISVSPKDNDNPAVRILEPIQSIEIREDRNIRVSWDATDQNHIVRYELYLSPNPANESTWIEIDKNIAYNQTSYSLDINNIEDGTYRIIVKAIDNQTPAAVGIDISEEIVIATGTEKTEDEIDDKVELPQPQIINVSPTSTDEIKNRRPTIKASLIAAQGETVDEDSIVVKLDDIDITNSVNFNRISDSEYTVIYLPEENISEGLHKVEITLKDSSGTEAIKDWTFTILSDDENDGNLNIFGYSIPTRTAIIIGGGLALIALAIIIPIIIFAVWKDQSDETPVENPTLPPTLPTEDSIPLDTTPNNINNLVTQAPPPVPVEETPPVQPAPPPEPKDDLDLIYSQIKELEGEDSKQTDSTPPEPIL